MKTLSRLSLSLFVLLAAAVVVHAETWKSAAFMDSACVIKFKGNLDAHSKECALQCQKNGYGLVAADGTFLKFDAAGNDKAFAALKETKKTDHLKVTVEGTKDGDTIKVTSLTFD